MKKWEKTSLALVLCLVMLLGSASAAPGLLISAKADDAQVVDQFADAWELLTEEETGLTYWHLDAIYCQNPTEGITTSSDDGIVQHLEICAPESYMKKNADGTVSIDPDGSVISSTGLVYTAENAPVILHNMSGGYTSSKVYGITSSRDSSTGTGYVEEGYVLVGIQTRGREIQNAEGKYIGQLPLIMVDLKAGIRFLKYFDEYLPGDAQHIVSRGVSSGGAVSAMLGATGNSSIFEPYLEEIGAYEATDDVFVAVAAAPITNLNSADASYEWFQNANPTYFLFNAMAYDREGNQLENFPVGPKNTYPLGSNVLGGAHEDELSDILYDWYVDYIQELGFDLGDDGRSGAFYEGFVEVYEAALEEYIQRYDELTFKGSYNMSGTEDRDDTTIEEYLAGLDPDGTGWFAYDETTGEVTIQDLDTMVQNHIQRKKMCPSLDSYNYKSNENDAFKDEDGNIVHFSGTVYEALQELLDGYNDGTIEISGIKDPKTGETAEFTDEDLEYLTLLVEDYKSAGSEEDMYMLEVMSPINYIIGMDGFDDATMAPYWRLRVGSEDGDHGAPAAWLILNGLETYHPEVDASFGVAWGMGHSLAELVEQDFFDYVGQIWEEEGFAVDVNQFADQWKYYVDESGVAYYALDAVYCANPVLPEVQHLVIYAPAAYMTQNADGTVAVNPNGKIISSTGVTYTAETAPMIYHNTSGGYSSSTIQPVNLDYLREGYIHVTVATRGKETKSVVNEYTGIYDREAMEATKDAEGEYIGQFPAIMVDLKAGIRFLKAYDNVLPGNSERIVSRGYSSGGAVSAMLGASGNSPIFDSYLEEIGAPDATDDIFITLASAPITNLSSADASYEWYQYANETYFLFNAMAFDRLGNNISDIFPVGPTNKYPLGSNILGGAHEDELSALLYDWYVDYVQGLGFDLGDDGRSGEFYEGFAQIYSDALTEFVARYDELKGMLVSPKSPTPPATAEDYLATLGEGWFTYDKETGKVTINSLDDVIVNHIARKKMCPSLDSYNYKSNENDAFTDAEGNTVHFSPVVRDALKTLIDEKDTYQWTEEELQYITDLYNDYAAGVTDEAAYMLEVMSPINYVVGAEGFEEATISPYWRLRVGSEDGDHGAPAAWLIAQGLEKYTDADVSVGIAWGMGHSLSELTEQDLYDYIADIMVKEDQLPVVKASFDDVSANDWYFDAAEYVNAQGLMGGVGANRFAPQTNTNRAMLMTILARLDGVDTAGGATWYEKGAAWAVENKVSDGTNPEGLITRQEIVTMLWRYAQNKGYDVSVGEDTNILSYDDALSVAEWAIPAMQWACGAGIVQGSGGSLNPGAAASRAEIAVMLMRFCENVK